MTYLSDQPSKPTLLGPLDSDMAPSTPPSTTPKPLVVNRPIPPERIILYFAALHKDNVQFPAPYKTMSELSGGKITPGALTTQFGEAKKLARELTEGKWEFTGTMTGPNSGKGKKRGKYIPKSLSSLPEVTNQLLVQLRMRPMIATKVHLLHLRRPRLLRLQFSKILVTRRKRTKEVLRRKAKRPTQASLLKKLVETRNSWFHSSSPR